MVAVIRGMKRITIAAIVVINSALVLGVSLALGEEKIVYLLPEKFVAFPVWALEDLKKQKCHIPQAVFFNPKPHNLIRGEFVTKGQMDWIALCSDRDTSFIFLLSRSRKKCVEKIAEADNAAYVQQVDKNRFEYSRMIETAGKNDIVRSVQKQEVNAPLAKGEIDHEGVINTFVEKSSSIFYCKDGKWIELQAEN